MRFVSGEQPKDRIPLFPPRTCGTIDIDVSVGQDAHTAGAPVAISKSVAKHHGCHKTDQKDRVTLRELKPIPHGQLRQVIERVTDTRPTHDEGGLEASDFEKSSHGMTELTEPPLTTPKIFLSSHLNRSYSSCRDSPDFPEPVSSSSRPKKEVTNKPLVFLSLPARKRDNAGHDPRAKGGWST